MNQTEDCSPEDSLLDYSEKLLWGSMVSAQFMSCQNNRDTLIQGFKKKKKPQQISMYTASQYGLGTWEGSLIIQEVPALASQREAFNLFFPQIYFLIEEITCRTKIDITFKSVDERKHHLP